MRLLVGLALLVFLAGCPSPQGKTSAPMEWQLTCWSGGQKILETCVEARRDFSPGYDDSIYAVNAITGHQLEIHADCVLMEMPQCRIKPETDLPEEP